MAGKFEIFVDSGNKFRFRLKVGNGQIILASEAYKGKSGCTNGIASVKKNAPNDDRYEQKEASDGKPMFNLRAKYNQVIGTSETYVFLAARENGIESVKANAPNAAINDLTI
jgi:hypothetical protein